jgi:ADP-ribosylglycohydrolase
VKAQLRERARTQQAEKIVRAPLDPFLSVSRGVTVAQRLGATASLTTVVRKLGNGAKGSCADTVPLALWIAFTHLDDFPTAIRHALAAGGDTDTVAAIVGGILASRLDSDAIPESWRQAVELLPLVMKKEG